MTGVQTCALPISSVLPLLLIILIFKWYVGFSYYINNVYYGRIRKDGGRDQRYSKHYTKVKVNIYKDVEVANLDRYLEQKQQHFTRFVVRFYALKSMALKKKVKSRPIVSSILFITLALFSVVFVRLYFTALGLDI